MTMHPLLRNGFCARIAPAGSIDIELLCQKRADLVILYISLPDDNGFYVANELRAEVKDTNLT